MKKIMNYILIMVLLSTIVTALPISVETDIEVETYQEDNKSWVRISTIEDEYEFDCSLNREYDFDIDFIEEVDCTQESDITNLTKSLVKFSNSNIRNDIELNNLLNRTVSDCISDNKELNQKYQQKSGQLIECRTELNHRVTKKDHDQLHLNMTKTQSLLQEESESKSFGYMIAFFIGALGSYYFQKKKYPRGSDPGVSHL